MLSEPDEIVNFSKHDSNLSTDSHRYFAWSLIALKTQPNCTLIEGCARNSINHSEVGRCSENQQPSWSVEACRFHAYRIARYANPFFRLSSVLCERPIRAEVGTRWRLITRFLESRYARVLISNYPSSRSRSERCPLSLPVQGVEPGMV